ncbi:hypothetical protein ACFL0D_06015 [Thermoproteota archaeon]
MREGEAFIEIDVLTRSRSLPTLGSGFDMNPLSGISSPISEQISSSKLLWREKTGVKKGWLLKKDEQKTLNVFGRRCPSCGFIELFAQK